MRLEIHCHHRERVFERLPLLALCGVVQQRNDDVLSQVAGDDLDVKDGLVECRRFSSFVDYHFLIFAIVLHIETRPCHSLRDELLVGTSESGLHSFDLVSLFVKSASHFLGLLLGSGCQNLDSLPLSFVVLPILLLDISLQFEQSFNLLESCTDVRILLQDLLDLFLQGFDTAVAVDGTLSVGLVQEVIHLPGVVLLLGHLHVLDGRVKALRVHVYQIS